MRAGCPKAIGENPSFPSSNPCWSFQLTADARAGPTAPNHPSAEFAPNACFPTAPASFPLLSSSVGNKTAEGRVLLCTAWAPVPEHLCRGETEEAQGSDKSLSQGSPKGAGTDHKPANPHSIAAGRSDGKGRPPDDSQCSQGQPQSLHSLSAVSSAALPPPCRSLHSTGWLWLPCGDHACFPWHFHGSLVGTALPGSAALHCGAPNHWPQPHMPQSQQLEPLHQPPSDGCHLPVANAQVSGSLLTIPQLGQVWPSLEGSHLPPAALGFLGFQSTKHTHAQTQTHVSPPCGCQTAGSGHPA